MTHGIYGTRTVDTTTSKTLKGLLLTGVILPAMVLPAWAQETPPSEDDVIVVEGVRRTIQSSITTKREAVSVVDALSVEDIGDLPALSIGEALETITGASSHREQGGATEIAIRGLGPYLGSTVINGREASNGSGDRSVNFSQFPSELIRKLEIYKTQEARLIEGGVSGQIALSTLKPVDYGKRRIQAELKGEYHPDNSDLRVNERDLGYRGTFSFVDSFELDNGGNIGISFGVQKRLSTNPEQEARTSSGFRDCRADVSGDPDSDNRGVDSLGDTDQNCDSGGGDLTMEVDTTTGLAPDAGTPFVLVSSQRHLRQNITADDRESIFAAVQWQPNARWDINADVQYSDRVFTEERNDLTIDGNSLLNVGETGEIVPLSISSTGALLGGTVYDGAEVSSHYMERLEEYLGGGISASFQATDKLNVSVDLSYSDTQRRENIIQSRLRSDTDGDSGSEDVFVGVAVEDDAHRFIFRDFDVSDPDNFDVGPRVREDLNQYRNNTITAVRADVDYAVDGEFVTSVLAGVRLSKLEYDSVPRVRRETDGNPLTVGDGAAANAACLRATFPETGLLSSVIDGSLITNIDANGNVLSTGDSWVSFDPLCLARELLGREASVPDIDDVFLERSVMGTSNSPISIVDVEEETIAAYAQANFASEWQNYPVRGNVGLRVVNTTASADGFRSTVTVTRDADTGVITSVGQSGLTEISREHDYTEYLPSANLVVDLSDTVLLRAAVFRGLSRPDPSDLGADRTFNVTTSDDLADEGFTSASDVVNSVTANGNTKLDPLLSWNYDAAVEWYPNADSILAVGLYYKKFNGGFANVGQVETFTIGDETIEQVVVTQETSSAENTITGLEITAAHAFNYLPEPWDGLGFKLSYNYADSDFEFEDANFGAATVVNTDGSTTQRVALVAPANVPGLSEHVASVQLYYDIGRFGFQGVYKYRSEYFQQFISTPGNLRFIGDTGVYEARASYKVNDNVKVTLEGINLFDEPRVQYNPTRDSFAEVNVYGPRLFFGVKGKF